MAIALLFGACVDDDSLFPDTTDNKVSVSTSLIAALNALTSGSQVVPENELCFKFEYPITLGYNTDSSIRLDNYNGLVDVLSSQNSNFNVNGIVFPFDIKFSQNDSIANIKNETDFLRNLKLCGISTFRNDFTRSFRECIKFDYPVTLLTTNNVEEVIANEDEFDLFYQNQGGDYQPSFKFPIGVLKAPDFSSVRISTYFEFYELIKSCIVCPEVRFDIEPLSENTFQIIPDFEIRNGDESFFSIDDQVITDVVINGEPFDREFTALGTYEVCIKVVTRDCPEGVKVCKEIVVASICPDLKFEATQEQSTFSYNFEANFPEINEVVYSWVVDDQIIEENDGGANGDNRFTFQFTPGIHNVCITTETPSCPNGTEFCEQIIVCPELLFESQQQGNSTTYDFFAEFLGMENVTYQWTINDEVQETDGGVEGDNTFTFQFTPGATYEVCIITEIAGCTDGVKFCETIVIP